MTEDVIMPFLSETMTEGTVTQWLKQVGDTVAFGDPLVEIGTDKVDVVYDADTAGRLVEILVGDGETVPCGQAIARIDTTG